MKNLLVMRHAKSAYPPSIADDFDRPLSKRGRKDLACMANLLASAENPPDLILSSSAVRAEQTATAMAAAVEIEARNFCCEDRLYLAAPAGLSAAVAGLPDPAKSVLIIGHNPGLEEWIGLLCGADLRLPTSGLAALRLDITRWAQIHEAQGQLRWFAIPRLLRNLA